MLEFGRELKKMPNPTQNDAWFNHDLKSLSKKLVGGKWRASLVNALEFHQLSQRDLNLGLIVVVGQTALYLVSSQV